MYQGSVTRFMSSFLCVSTLLVGVWTPTPCHAGTVLDDVNDTITKLNPISGAVGSLIGQAEVQGNTILQQRLEQLSGMIQASIERARSVK